MRFHASAFTIGLALSAGILLSACTSNADSATSPGTEPTTVRLLAHDSFVVSQPLIDQFKKDTGITIEVTTGGDAGTMVAGAVLAAGAPSADVMFGIDNTLLSKAVDAQVFSPYTATDADAVIPSLRNDTAGGLVTPIDYGDVCVNIDDVWFAKHHLPVPTNIDQLTSAKYKDQLVVEDPASSSPGLAFMLATIAKYGDSWPQYWEKLNANGVKVSGSWTDAYESVFSASKGDRPLVVSYATSPPAEMVYATGRSNSPACCGAPRTRPPHRRSWTGCSPSPSRQMSRCRCSSSHRARALPCRRCSRSSRPRCPTHSNCLPLTSMLTSATG